ncbi:MAG TPA: A/G-specific adenine glycosylase [Polyangiaceae bacterium]|nr:A/G-specific adenine glycosylase [Polyangiaceae bacterium]
MKRRARVEATPEAVQRALLPWYEEHRRDLPWRRTSDPYAVWVSEVMLQQTQVATVRDYYARWMKRFPTVSALAKAEESDVLHAWQGLGYYSRARNLKRGAEAVVERHRGAVPKTVAELLELPGIGPYSAGAISSIAHGERAPIVDGNVVRVLSRLFALRGDPAKAPLEKELWRRAEDLVPSERPGDFNQALMELGATVCTPRSPTCLLCPLRMLCAARRDGIVEELPEIPKREKPIPVHRAAAVVTRGEKVLVVQLRADAPRWAGMWQFPNADVAKGETPEAAAARSVREMTGLVVPVGERLTTVRHSVTRYRITLDVHRSASSRGRPKPVIVSAAEWKTLEELDDLALPSAHRRIANAVQPDD